VYTATGLREKRLQKSLLLYWNPEHWPLAREALKLAGREDLIGRGPHALVPPESPAEAARRQRTESNRDRDDADALPRDAWPRPVQPRPSTGKGRAPRPGPRSR
jgi:hypothetical protein